MGFFVWKDSYLTGIDAIDLQHRKFLDLLNRCHEQMVVERRSAIDPELVGNLEDYADKHFQTEESLMRAKAYPDLFEHVKHHKYFEGRVDDLSLAAAGKGDQSAGVVLSFMRDWLLEHILNEDMKYVPYLKQKKPAS